MVAVHSDDVPSPDKKKPIPDGKSLNNNKYLEPYSKFEPQINGLGTWVLLFMTKDEIFDIAPTMKAMTENDSHSLLKFTQYLNPTYISFRTEYILKMIGERLSLEILKARNAESMIRAWNNADGYNQKNSITRAFAAMDCFKLFHGFKEAITHCQGLRNTQELETYFETSFYAMLAELDRASPPPNTSTIEKWRKVKNLGETLFLLAKDFGGDGFLMVSPPKIFIYPPRTGFGPRCSFMPLKYALALLCNY